MRILIYGINYAPELTGIGKYTGEMGAWLANHGQEVAVITAQPYYPEWAVHSHYKDKGWHSEKLDNAKVYRCPLYVPTKVTAIKRIIHEFSFMLSSLIYWIPLLFQRKYDLVFCVAPPFHLGILPLLYARLKGAKFITHIQDLQVDAAKELGMIKNKNFLNIMFRMEEFLLQSSDMVSTISNGMRKKIMLKGIPEDKMIHFPNWVDENDVTPMLKSQSLRKEWNIDLNDRVILYSGNLGEKQGLDIILDLALKFNKEPSIKFLIVGSGGEKEKLIEKAKAYNLKNLNFYPLQPYSKMSSLLATADLHLVLQKASASDLVMPSKLTGILSAGGCAIVTALPGTSLYNAVAENNMGILCEPESVKHLESTIRKALNTNLDEIKNNAREYVEQHLTKNKVLANFLATIETI